MKTLRTHAEKLVRLLKPDFGDDAPLGYVGELELTETPGAADEPSLVQRSLATPARPRPTS